VTDTRTAQLAWLDERLEGMLLRPRMWGSNLAVELQVLLLLEMRSLVVDRERENRDPGRVMDAYDAWRTRARLGGNCPLASRFADDKGGSARFTEALRGFVEEQQREDAGR
jgi:hypothetical protein